MHFRAFQLKVFIPYLLSAMLYPAYAYLSASSGQLLKLIDALTVTGLVFLILGLVYSLMIHGDFDISEYVARRSLNKGNIKPFRAFKDDKNEERKGKFNYPFFTGLLMLIVSYILAQFVY